MNRFTVIDCEQDTPEWLAARAGYATASRAHCIKAKSRTKNEEASTRRNYRVQLLTERLTGQSQESTFRSLAMDDGKTFEPRALAAYEAATGLIVRRTGFLKMTNYRAGCSLDGSVNDFKILVSAKCPQPPAHLDYLWHKRIPPKYVPQVTHELWVTGADVYDFISYNETFPEKLQLLHVRAYREEFDVSAYEAEVLEFLEEIERDLKQLEGWKPPQVA